MTTRKCSLSFLYQFPTFVLKVRPSFTFRLHLKTNVCQLVGLLTIEYGDVLPDIESANQYKICCSQFVG